MQQDFNDDEHERRDVPRYPAGHSGLVRRQRIGRARRADRSWTEPLQATLLAFAILMLILTTAFGTLQGSATFLRHLFPDRHFDAFGALHRPLVLGLLLGASVLWVLPPHPWAAKPSDAALLDSEGGAA